ncbi:Tn3 family transposase [Tenebrionicola larvae]|uniref:Tn3 family transposase n=1 Tax=Tenebrionicola larvae TaxID=2815733 RepID=UPI0020116D6D|nr:Tn3 family transposase [Tenebrionicola larvae]
MPVALEHLRNEGEVINEGDEPRLSPLRHAHINMLGHSTHSRLRTHKQAQEADEYPL